MQKKKDKLCSEAVNLLNDNIKTHISEGFEFDLTNNTQDLKLDSSDCSAAVIIVETFKL